MTDEPRKDDLRSSAKEKEVDREQWIEGELAALYIPEFRREALRKTFRWMQQHVDIFKALAKS